MLLLSNIFDVFIVDASIINGVSKAFDKHRNKDDNKYSRLSCMYCVLLNVRGNLCHEILPSRQDLS